MGKRKPAEPTIDDLVALSEEVGLAPGSLDDELHDVCESEKRERLAGLRAYGLREQLEFLRAEGYAPSRLAEIIRELAES